MRKIIFDLTKFDNAQLLTKYFNSIEDIDNYIKEISGLEFDKKSSTFGARNYIGDYHYFTKKNSDRIADVETFAILRTYINKYENGYGISSWDFGYHSPLGWKCIDMNNVKIETIENENSHKVHFREQ